MLIKTTLKNKITENKTNYNLKKELQKSRIIDVVDPNTSSCIGRLAKKNRVHFEIKKLPFIVLWFNII